VKTELLLDAKALMAGKHGLGLATLERTLENMDRPHSPVVVSIP
jgi:hypothetical protein